MILHKTFAVLGAMGLLLLSAPVFAQSKPAESLARLQASSAAQGVALDDATKATLRDTCKTAQANLQLIRQKEARNYQAYGETFLDVQNEISALELRLKRQGVTVQGIDRTLLNYKERVDQYDRLNYLYQQALSDVIVIDCAANPNEFTAGIVSVRQLRSQLLQTTVGLKEYIVKDIYDQFNKVKAQLNV